MSTDYDLMIAESSTAPMVHDDEPDYAPPVGATMLPGASDLGSLLQVAAGLGATRAPLTRLAESARAVGQSLGSDAYYSFPAGKQTVEGASIRLMEALKGVYGYLYTDVTVTDVRDGRAYLRALTVDLLQLSAHTEGRVAALSEPGGNFARSAEQRARWEAMQLGAACSKTLRVALLRAIPPQLVRVALQAAKNAKQPPSGRPLDDVLDALVAAFAASRSAVTVAELEEVAQLKRAQWTVREWRVLDDLYRALKNKETTVEEVWPHRVGPTTTSPRPAAPALPAPPLDVAPLDEVLPAPAVVRLDRGPIEELERRASKAQRAEARHSADLDPSMVLARMTDEEAAAYGAALASVLG